MAGRFYHGKSPEVSCWRNRARGKKGAAYRKGEPFDHALGRSRGGFSSKIHCLCDRNAVPLAATLSSGAAHDSKHFVAVMQQVSIPTKRGRPRNRPEEVVADKGYDASYLRRYLGERGIKAMIPEKKQREGTKRRKKGPRPRFNKETYKERASVEQSIGWIKEYRRIATRYEKLAAPVARSISWQWSNSLSSDDTSKHIYQTQPKIDHLLARWKQITSDPKLIEFTHQVKTTFFQSKKNKQGKLVIFTESKETAQELSKALDTLGGYRSFF